MAILSIRTQKWKVAESSATRARRAACCFCFPCMFLNLGLFLRNWVFTRQVLPRVAPKKLDLVDRLVCFLDFKILARQEERWSSNSGSRVPLQLLPCSEYEDNTCSIGATSAYWHPLVPTAIRLLLRSPYLPGMTPSILFPTRNISRNTKHQAFCWHLHVGSSLSAPDQPILSYIGCHWAISILCGRLRPSPVVVFPGGA